MTASVNDGAATGHTAIIPVFLSDVLREIYWASYEEKRRWFLGTCAIVYSMPEEITAAARTLGTCHLDFACSNEITHSLTNVLVLLKDTGMCRAQSWARKPSVPA